MDEGSGITDSRTKHPQSIAPRGEMAWDPAHDRLLLLVGLGHQTGRKEYLALGKKLGVPEAAVQRQLGQLKLEQNHLLEELGIFDYAFEGRARKKGKHVAVFSGLMPSATPVTEAAAERVLMDLTNLGLDLGNDANGRRGKPTKALPLDDESRTGKKAQEIQRRQEILAKRKERTARRLEIKRSQMEIAKTEPGASEGQQDREGFDLEPEKEAQGIQTKRIKPRQLRAVERRKRELAKIEQKAKQAPIGIKKAIGLQLRKGVLEAEDEGKRLSRLEKRQLRETITEKMVTLQEEGKEEMEKPATNYVERRELTQNQEVEMGE